MYYIFALGHLQQLSGLLAPIGLLGVLVVLGMRRGFARKIIGLQVIAAFALAYLLLNASVNMADELSSNPIGFFSGDGRAIYMIAVLLVLSSLPWHKNDLQTLFRAAVMVPATIALISLICYFVSSSPVFGGLPFGVMNKDGRPVLVGLVGTKNPFAGSTAQGLVLAVAAIVHWKKIPSIASRRWLWAAALVMGLGLLLSGSRGYFGGFLAAAGYLMVASPKSGTYELIQRGGRAKRIGVMLLLVAFIATFVSMFSQKLTDAVDGEDMNVTRRIELFERSWEIATSSFLTGLGPGAVTQYGLKYEPVVSGLISIRTAGEKLDEFVWKGDLPVGQHSHNVFLQTMSDYGLLGLIFVAMVFFYPLKYSSRNYVEAMSQFPELSFSIFCLKALSIYYCVSGLVAGYTMFSPSISWSFYALLPLTARGAEYARKFHQKQMLRELLECDAPGDQLQRDDHRKSAGAAR